METLTSVAPPPPEPIPLRAVTLLLNYERTTSDPRYKGLKLGGSTRGDLGMAEGVKNLIPKIWEGEAESVMRRSVHIFAPDAESEVADTKYTPATCIVHPLATDGVKGLSLADRDLIFYETRGNGGDWDAIRMFQAFFALCPEGQEVLVQIGDEKPLLFPISSHTTVVHILNSPKHDIRTVIQGPAESDITSTSSGAFNGETHSVLAFRRPPVDMSIRKKDEDEDEDKKGYAVVDMTLLQYGAAGRGLYGENYFLGPYSSYSSTMTTICGEMRVQRMIASSAATTTTTSGTFPTDPQTQNQTPNQPRIQQCAQHAWQRWQNRAQEGWCEYCGRGGKELKRCSACKGRKVWFCCEEHQKAGWKLHRLSCEVEKPVVLGPKRVEEE